jgi:hypothetical protein
MSCRVRGRKIITNSEIKGGGGELSGPKVQRALCPIEGVTLSHATARTQRTQAITP